MFLRQPGNLTHVKDGETSEGGVLVTQERTTDSDTAKVDANSKADSSDGSNTNTPNINVKRGIGKLCAIAISLFRNVY